MKLSESNILKQTTFKIFTLAVLMSLIACTSEKFKEPQKLGNRWISAKTLNVGHDTYMNYCMQCHGVEGDGMGPAAQGSNHPPRNFKQGLYKFANVDAGELPTDEDLKRTIRHGLRGTPMLPWDLSPERLDAVVQYIKTFSDAWKDGEPGAALAISDDPFGETRKQEAIALGEKVYHGIAQCYSCHPSYLSLEEINKVSQELTGNSVTSTRENPHLATLLDSSYNYKIMPPDFTKNWIKSGYEPIDIYTVLNAGLNGSAMAAWKGLLSTTGSPEESERNQWALSYYVASLQKLKLDDAARKAFFQDLNAKRSLAR